MGQECVHVLALFSTFTSCIETLATCLQTTKYGYRLQIPFAACSLSCSFGERDSASERERDVRDNKVETDFGSLEIVWLTFFIV